MPLSSYKTKRLRLVFIVYWFLLAYIIAALVWWFIALNNQNHQVALHDIEQLKKDSPAYYTETAAILSKEKRKTSQYIGEGIVFFLVIMAGAIFIFRAVRRQLKLGLQQQHFMMAITHELKTPIAVTKLNLETLQKRKLDESQQQRLIQNTIQEANRLNALCNNILLVSQIEENRYNVTTEEINMSELVNECVKDFISRFPLRTYHTGIDSDIFVKGDRLLLQIATNNLIENASKYSPKEKPVTIILIKEAAKIKLSVKDEGNGIPPEDKRKIFDKFYRIGNKATKEAKGTGLGLYLTKKIAQQHKAVIYTEDNSPGGSIFTIEF
ncbi:MAG TPA: ATP-binding protein [Ferruginibacter sp.]|nr:ATP-binding protein [Ferruginibacter sp.]